MNGFGIDFGTTNSVVAVCDSRDGKVRALTDSDNKPHPSVVWYRGDAVTVGRDAKHQVHGYSAVPGNVFVPSVKRKLGSEYSYSIFGEKKMAWEIAADIFRHLKKHALAEYKQDIENAVVTVPVNYDGLARAELRKAANSAGVEISAFIHEPFAAVIGYCNSMGGIQAFENRQILVFDWGGGTLDITVARIKDTRVFELSTSGLIDIAGDHFDSRVQRFARARFLERNALDDDKVSFFPNRLSSLAFECEKAKIELSSEDTASLLLENIFEKGANTYDLNENINRDDFEKMIMEDVNGALRQVDKALDSAAITAQEIDTVLLIGGSSRIPMLHREMSKRFGKRTVDLTNGDTIIAEGASIIARNGWVPYLVRPIMVRLSDGSDYPVFEEGRVLKPEGCRKSVNFFCTDNRDGEAHLVIVESGRKGDSSSTEVKRVMNVKVNDKLSRTGERVTAQFEIDEDLEFHARAWGAIDRVVSSTSIHDLCFGIRAD